jgi:hypothetical protein
MEWLCNTSECAGQRWQWTILGLLPDPDEGRRDAQGRRPIDYLDLHWYPEAKGNGFRIVMPKTTPTAAADIAAWEDTPVTRYRRAMSW